jgi:hypothetical protein
VLPPRYFAERYFAGRYFANGADGEAPSFADLAGTAAGQATASGAAIAFDASAALAPVSGGGRRRED